LQPPSDRGGLMTPLSNLSLPPSLPPSFPPSLPTESGAACSD
jgi:hypothetical protein